MTRLQVYKMAGTENELLNHINVTRQPHDKIEGSVMSGLVEGVRRRGRPKMCWFDNIYNGLVSQVIVYYMP